MKRTFFAGVLLSAMVIAAPVCGSGASGPHASGPTAERDAMPAVTPAATVWPFSPPRATPTPAPLHQAGRSRHGAAYARQRPRSRVARRYRASCSPRAIRTAAARASRPAMTRAPPAWTAPYSTTTRTLCAVSNRRPRPSRLLRAPPLLRFERLVERDRDVRCLRQAPDRGRLARRAPHRVRRCRRHPSAGHRERRRYSAAARMDIDPQVGARRVYLQPRWSPGGDWLVTSVGGQEGATRCSSVRSTPRRTRSNCRSAASSRTGRPDGSKLCLSQTGYDLGNAAVLSPDDRDLPRCPGAARRRHRHDGLRLGCGRGARGQLSVRGR